MEAGVNGNSRRPGRAVDVASSLHSLRTCPLSRVNEQHQAMSEYDSTVTTERRHYYSSSQGPFYNASNVLMFYGGGERGTLVETLIHAVRDGGRLTEEPSGRLIHVHGEAGSGKTMLSLVLADRLQQRHNLIRYDHRTISPAQLLRHLLIELCPQQVDLISAEQAAACPPGGQAQKEILSEAVLQQAREHIVKQLQQPTPGNKPMVMIVDSQAEPTDEICLLLEDLTSVMHDGDVALRVVYFQRTEAGVARAHVSQQAIENHYWLGRLSLIEVNEYLRHHMMLFDFNQRNLFSRDMGYFIADRSEGVFRSINTLARNAFTIASLDDTDKLSMSHLLMAGLPPRQDTGRETRHWKRYRRAIVALIATSVVVSGALGVLAFL